MGFDGYRDAATLVAADLNGDGKSDLALGSFQDEAVWLAFSTQTGRLAIQEAKYRLAGGPVRAGDRRPEPGRQRRSRGRQGSQQRGQRAAQRRPRRVRAARRLPDRRLARLGRARRPGWRPRAGRHHRRRRPQGRSRCCSTAATGRSRRRTTTAPAWVRSRWLRATSIATATRISSRRTRRGRSRCCSTRATVSFRAKADYAAGGAPNSLALADFDGDGFLDAAVAQPARPASQARDGAARARRRHLSAQTLLRGPRLHEPARDRRSERRRQPRPRLQRRGRAGRDAEPGRRDLPGAALVRARRHVRGRATSTATGGSTSRARG